VRANLFRYFNNLTHDKTKLYTFLYIFQLINQKLAPENEREFHLNRAPFYLTRYSTQIIFIGAKLLVSFHHLPLAGVYGRYRVVWQKKQRRQTMPLDFNNLTWKYLR